jgi:uncharacterized protein YraI
MCARSCNSCVPSALGAVVGSLIVALASPALANPRDVVFAASKLQLHVRPGEAAPVVGHADEGEELEVVGDQGRWIRVRSGKQVGWVTRTEIIEAQPAAPRTRVQKTGFSGKPVTDALKVTVLADRVRGFDDPVTKSKSVLDLAKGETVTVIGRGTDGWILVEQSNGNVGWIPASVVTDGGKFAGDPRQAPGATAKVATAPAAGAGTPDEVRPTPPSSSSKRGLSIGVLATAGAQTFKLEQTGVGAATATASGPFATIGARGQMRVRGSMWAGVTTMAEFGTADMIYEGNNETSNPMSTQELAVNAYGELGWGGARYIALRGGVHYSTMSVESERNEPMLLGERIAGATVGLGGALPLYRRLTFSAAFDVMPLGAQKLNRLPDGALYADTVQEMWARAALSMPLPAHLMAAVCYRFGALSAELSDGAATPKTANRSDMSHVVTAGVGMTW